MLRSSQPSRHYGLDRIRRRLLAYSLDMTAFFCSGFLAFELRFDGALPAQFLHRVWTAMCVWAVLKSAAFMLGRVSCESCWRVRWGQYLADQLYFFCSGLGEYRDQCMFWIG